MKSRITVPDNHIALILPDQLASELRGLLRMIRLRRIKQLINNEPARSVAGDVLLEMLEDDNWAGIFCPERVG